MYASRGNSRVLYWVEEHDGDVRF